MVKACTVNSANIVKHMLPLKTGFLVPLQNASNCNTVFNLLDALHVDASADLTPGGLGVIRSRRLQNSTFKLTPLLLLTQGTKHTIC